MSERTFSMNDLFTYVIWSGPDRKIVVLTADAEDLAFTLGPTFLVLGVEAANDGSGAMTVFLAERSVAESFAADSRLDESSARETEDWILERLRQHLTQQRYDD